MATTAKKAAAKKPAAKRTSGNPAKKAAAQAAAAEASSISAFKTRHKGIPLPLPSGLVVRAKRVELKTLITKGSVPNPLMEVVSEALRKGQAADIEKMVGVDEDEIDLDTVNDMFDLVSRIIIESVTEPKVWPEPAEGEERDEDLLYVDEFDADDQMFIYQWACGGTSDLEQFREEARADMATLAKKQGAKSKAK